MWERVGFLEVLNLFMVLVRFCILIYLDGCVLVIVVFEGFGFGRLFLSGV